MEIVNVMPASYIDIERFMNEVKSRSSIWDCSSEEYKDRDLKKRQWNELCSIFHAEFEMSCAKDKVVLYLRTNYEGQKDCFLENHLVSTDPIVQFTSWFNEVKGCQDIIEPNAMCIATANKNGIPSSRMVLLKEFGPEGFKFFTNYESRKGCDLEENPNAALLFYWPPFNKQVRIEGVVTKVSAKDSIEYFNKRPLESRFSAAISPQSRPVPNRQYLIDAVDQLKSKGTVERPDFWGGYLVRHERVEFWQGQTDRLHDRLLYAREGEAWKVSRLAP